MKIKANLMRSPASLRPSQCEVAKVVELPSLDAWKGQWFPTENGGSWVIFVGTFFGTFILMTIGFDIYFRITGRKYDGLLGQYRREKEENEE